MPANLPPQYFDVEKKYREAKVPQEKLVYLQEMLAIIPKHKGTEKIQADLKSKISKIKEDMARPKKSKGSGGTWFQVEKQGAGQVSLVGLPNCGKSSLLNTLTNAHVEVGSYPFTTTLPQIGMMDFQDIKIQIVDTPPLHADAPAWLFGIYRNSDMLVIILDLTSDLYKDFETVNNLINQHNIYIKAQASGDVKNAIIVLNKSDQSTNQSASDKFMAEFQNAFVITVFASNETSSIEALKTAIFKKLNIIRVYTKRIGQPVAKKDPVVLKAGTNVLDAAEYIHKDFKKNLKFARLWNDTGYSGQRVEKSYILADGDVLEFHA